MTKEEILAREAGRELDAKVEEELFGHQIEWRYCNWLPQGYFETQSFGAGKEVVGGLLDENELHPCYRDGEKWTVVPFYSKDMSDAWLVMEKLKEDWDCITLLWDFGAWDMLLERGAKKFYLGKESGATYVQLPEAICKAALLTRLEVKEDD